MNNEQLAISNVKKAGGSLYTLIPLEDFKAIAGVDDREDTLSRFCLVTATHTIEQYCKRRLLKKKCNEQLAMSNENELYLQLREYPVSKVLAVYAMSNEQEAMNNWELIEPEFYRVIPDCGSGEDWPYSLALSPALKRYQWLQAIKVVYTAGYAPGKAPADLASACLELAAWNMNRYQGRRIGMTGNVRGSGKDAEHFELSMPSNVCQLLEPYRRKLI